jgi:hypothetical protein
MCMYHHLYLFTKTCVCVCVVCVSQVLPVDESQQVDFFSKDLWETVLPLQ